MIVPIVLIIGATGSSISQSWLPLIGALVVSLIVHEFMLYDMHSHLESLEEN